MKINELLKESRKERKLTQEQVAEKIFVSNKTVSNWENGKTIPDIENVILLAKLFDLSLDSLLRDDEEMIKEIEKGSNSKRNLFWSVILLVPIFIILVISYSHFSYPYIEMLLRPFHLGFLMDSTIVVLSVIVLFSIVIGYNIFHLLSKQISKKFLKIQFTVYLLIVLYGYLFKSVGIQGLNLNPGTLINDIQNNFILSLINTLFFIPLGVYGAIKFKDYKTICIYSLLLLISLEIVQYIFSLGIADVSDVLLHFIGVLIGAKLTIMLKKYGYQLIENDGFYEIKLFE